MIHQPYILGQQKCKANPGFGVRLLFQKTYNKFRFNGEVLSAGFSCGKIFEELSNCFRVALIITLNI